MEDLQDLDERCQSSDIALAEGRSYIALLNDGQIPAYAVIKVCSSVPSLIAIAAVELAMLLHCHTAARSSSTEAPTHLLEQPWLHTQVTFQTPLSEAPSAAWASRALRDRSEAASRWLDSAADATGAMLGLTRPAAWKGERRRPQLVILRAPALPRRHRRQLAQSTSPTPTPTAVRLRCLYCVLSSQPGYCLDVRTCSPC